MPKYEDASIYLLEDINDLQYIGSTAQRNLYERLSTHKRDKKVQKGCSSAQLNLNYASMTLLEKCPNNAEDRKEKERYWIKQYPKCVNTKRLDSARKWCDLTEQQKKKRTASNKRWADKNRDKINARRRQNYQYMKLSNL